MANLQLQKGYFRADEMVVYFAISARTICRLPNESDLQATGSGGV
jgi:hypothetical protein